MEKNRTCTAGNFPKFLLLWLGQFVSAIGGGLTSFGLGVYVFDQTGSAASMSLVTLLGFLPGLLLSVPAGVLADRCDRRVLMMIGDGCSAVGIFYIFLAMQNGEASLVQICVGVCISSVFSSLLDPAYRATISDILTQEEFSKASGLMGLAGSARYLFAPVIAGALLVFYDIRLLLVIDIGTFFLTVASTAAVKRGIPKKRLKEDVSKEKFIESMKEGWRAVHTEKGVFGLILISSVITLFMGVFEVLSEPLILSFADAKTLGTAETVCAAGMMLTGIFLGVHGIQKNFTGKLGGSLALAGVVMFCFGLWENIILLSVFGFLFFATLPVANNCLDYLVRTNIPDALQGRAWGFIGFLSQMGYAVAYALSGICADTAAASLGITVGRGAAILVSVSGILLIAAALSIFSIKEIRLLEKAE